MYICVYICIIVLLFACKSIMCVPVCHAWIYCSQVNTIAYGAARPDTSRQGIDLTDTIIETTNELLSEFV